MDRLTQHQNRRHGIDLAQQAIMLDDMHKNMRDCRDRTWATPHVKEQRLPDGSLYRTLTVDPMEQPVELPGETEDGVNVGDRIQNHYHTVNKAPLSPLAKTAIGVAGALGAGAGILALMNALRPDPAPPAAQPPPAQVRPGQDTVRTLVPLPGE